MQLGLKRGMVSVEPHNPEWEDFAKEIIKELKEMLSAVAVDIQHVGSTAIKNISAKPIIDLAVAVLDFSPILSMNDKLEVGGFIFRGQDYDEQYLYVCGGEDYRTVHVHVVLYNSERWNNYLNMRDYLNSHKEDARAYSELKESLAKQYPKDRIKYTEMKSAFINEILNKAEEWRKCIGNSGK